QPRDLDRLRLLHLHDHLSGFEHGVGVRQNLHTDFFVDAIRRTDALARFRFQEDLMPGAHELRRALRRQADPILVDLNFLRAADFHVNSSYCAGKYPVRNGFSWIFWARPRSKRLPFGVQKHMPQEIPAQLDDFDHKILIELERDGVLTAAALAERVGLSPSACHRRVKAMEAAGVIEGYAAILSEKALGRSATVFVAVTLENQRSETMAAFERAVARCRDVQVCHLLSVVRKS